MEDGQAGVYGQTAATPVMLENRGDHERARHRPLYMEENPVQEQGMSSGCATRIHAQVNKGDVTVLLFQSNFNTKSQL